MERKLEGKVALITGASSGIGEGIAKTFLKQGAKIIGCGIEPDMKLKDDNAIYVQADISKLENAVNVVEEGIKRFGKITSLVSCAGITGESDLEDGDPSEFYREFNINTFGVYHICKASIKELKKHAGATIVTIGSDLGVRPIPGRIGYSPSKAAVIMLTKCIALEQAPSVRANCILPGLVETPMIQGRFAEAENPDALREEYASLYPLHRMGKVEDMANAAIFLSCEDSSFMTGESIAVSGGSLI